MCLLLFLFLIHHFLLLFLFLLLLLLHLVSFSYSWSKARLSVEYFASRNFELWSAHIPAMFTYPGQRDSAAGSESIALTTELFTAPSFRLWRSSKLWGAYIQAPVLLTQKEVIVLIKMKFNALTIQCLFTPSYYSFWGTVVGHHASLWFLLSLFLPALQLTGW